MKGASVQMMKTKVLVGDIMKRQVFLLFGNGCFKK